MCRREKIGNQELLEKILPRLNVVRGPDARGEYVCWCVYHADGQGEPPHRPNLQVSVRGFRCFACDARGSLRNLAAELGIAIGGEAGGNGRDRIAQTYDYCDENGVLLYQVVRKTPKAFYQRRPDGKDGWIDNLDGTRRVLYRLPDLISHPEALAWITEGEKDADRLVHDGLVATTNPGGAGKWRPEYTASLRGREIVIIADNDESGARHALKIEQSLAGVAGSVKILHLSDLPQKGDVSDWLNAGHSVAELRKLAEQASEFDPIADYSPAANKEGGTGLLISPSQVREAPDDPHRLAHIYLDMHCHDSQGLLTLRFWRHQWWRWSGFRYHLLDKEDLRAEITATMKEEFNRQGRCAQPDKDVRKVSYQLVTNTVQALSGIVLVPATVEQPAWLPVGDNDRKQLSMSNGLFDLEGFLMGEHRKMTPHTPEWFSPVHLPYVFDARSNCDRWQAFLNQVLEGDRERIHMIQEWFGYCLTADTSRQRFLVLEGDGANGKSVVCEILTGLLGEQNVSHVPLELFGQRFQLGTTLGRLANIAAEVGELDKAAEGVLKAFTSGDRMYFDRKGLPGVEAYPTARLVLATNNRPRFSDRSSGLWRRMILLPFQVSIPEENQDPQLARSLREELPGVFCWAIAGLYRLRRQGRFTESQICSEAIKDYRTESNPARLFLTESYSENLGSTVSCTVLYRQYRRWCDDNGYHPLGERMFGKEVMRVFPRIKRVRRGSRSKREYQYEGLAVSY